MKPHSGGLKIDEELFDLVGGANRDRSGEQMLAFPDVAGEDRLTNHSQVRLRIAPMNLPVKRRITIHEGNREAELGCIERARFLYVDYVELSFGELRTGRVRVTVVRRAIACAPYFEDSISIAFSPRAIGCSLETAQHPSR